MKIKAYAKINLILDVLKKREDGYHEIKFLMTLIDLYDEIEVVKNNINKVEVIGSQTIEQEENLAYKALSLLNENYSLKNKYKITIIKNIPICAGMGGGSSDCAAVLKVINKLEKLNLTDDELIKIAVKLGADVPFFIKGKLSIVSGIGEVVKSVDKSIPKSYVLVINCLEPLSTKEVYENYIFKKQNKLAIENILNKVEYESFYKQLRNDLEEVALNMNETTRNLKYEVESNFCPIKVMLSGSGPTILIFDTKEKLAEIKQYMQKDMLVIILKYIK